MKETCLEETGLDETWAEVAEEAIAHLAPYGPVVLLGLESARRYLGRDVDRKELVKARSVYALLMTSFERDDGNDGQQVLARFIQEPERYRTEIRQLVVEKAARSPDLFGRKLIALTNRWRENKRPLPPVG